MSKTWGEASGDGREMSMKRAACAGATAAATKST
jgi:hypothetical protein